MFHDGPPSAIRPDPDRAAPSGAGGSHERLPGHASGELDIQTAADLRGDLTAILAERPLPDHVIVDLQGVTFMDSLGLGTLVVGHRICGDIGRPVHRA